MKHIKFLWCYLSCFFFIQKKTPIHEQIRILKSQKHFFYQYVIVQHNYKKVLKRLRQKKSSKIKVCFLVSETSKWNLQSLHDDMLQSEQFQPVILVTNHKDYDRRQPYQHILDFYRALSPNVDIAWDEILKTGIDLKTFLPDIVFFQQPWGLYENQSLLYVSKFALTYYISYAIEDATIALQMNLDKFYRLLYKYLVFSEKTKMELIKSYPYSFNNVFPSGHPKLDVYKNYNPTNYKCRLLSHPTLPT